MPMTLPATFKGVQIVELLKDDALFGRKFVTQNLMKITEEKRSYKR